MANDTTQTIISTYQDSLLEGLSCSSQVREFLKNQKIGMIHEMYYLLALDGMAVTDLQRLERSVKDIGDPALRLEILKKERTKYLQKLYTDNNQLSIYHYDPKGKATKCFEGLTREVFDIVC